MIRKCVVDQGCVEGLVMREDSGGLSCLWTGSLILVLEGASAFTSGNLPPSLCLIGEGSLFLSVLFLNCFQLRIIFLAKYCILWHIPVLFSD